MICADRQVRPAELAVMMNVRMFTPSRERLPLWQRCALIRGRLLPRRLLVEQVNSLPFLRSVFGNVAQRVG